MSAPNETSSTQKYWLNGFVWSGVRKAVNPLDEGTLKYWINGGGGLDGFNILPPIPPTPPSAAPMLMMTGIGG